MGCGEGMGVERNFVAWILSVAVGSVGPLEHCVFLGTEAFPLPNQMDDIFNKCVLC